MRFLVVTGLSGAGKTSVNRYLEDMGAFCVDNLPPNMMFRMMEAIEKSALHRPLVAMAVDVRSGEFFDAKSKKLFSSVQFSVVSIISQEEIDASQKIADEMGIPLKVRIYS